MRNRDITKPWHTLLLLSLLLCLAGCEKPLPSNPGGELTQSLTDRNALQFPTRSLVGHKRLNFSLGHSFFRNPWVIAPSTTVARDGLGPLYNAHSCEGCHPRNGRGQLPADKPYEPHGLVFRLGERGSAPLPQSGVSPNPVLGDQLQTRALPGLRAEGQIEIQYQQSLVEVGDYPPVALRIPRYSIANSAAALDDTLTISPRLAPPLIGMGLLAGIPAEALESAADPEDRDGDGISGRVNHVWDRQAQKTTVGRFGWKAGQPSLKQQIASALSADIGVTSSLYPDSNCPGRILDCNNIPNGGAPEISDKLLGALEFYLSSLAVPDFRLEEKHRAGWRVFHEIGCHQCHTPRQQTTTADLAWLSQQTIYPFTDLLLHDMGERLADDRAEFEASGREWRTPPLWGLGLTETITARTGYLHDGRARTLVEAILWHGGEAEPAVSRFRNIDAFERLALIQFLNSL